MLCSHSCTFQACQRLQLCVGDSTRRRSHGSWSPILPSVPRSRVLCRHPHPTAAGCTCTHGCSTSSECPVRLANAPVRRVVVDGTLEEGRWETPRKDRLKKVRPNSAVRYIIQQIGTRLCEGTLTSLNLGGIGRDRMKLSQKCGRIRKEGLDRKLEPKRRISNCVWEGALQRVAEHHRQAAGSDGRIQPGGHARITRRRQAPG